MWHSVWWCDTMYDDATLSMMMWYKEPTWRRQRKWWQHYPPTVPRSAISSTNSSFSAPWPRQPHPRPPPLLPPPPALEAPPPQTAAQRQVRRRAPRWKRRKKEKSGKRSLRRMTWGRHVSCCRTGTYMLYVHDTYTRFGACHVHIHSQNACMYTSERLVYWYSIQ